jgi:hypothetical protein
MGLSNTDLFRRSTGLLSKLQQHTRFLALGILAAHIVVPPHWVCPAVAMMPPPNGITDLDLSRTDSTALPQSASKRWWYWAVGHSPNNMLQQLVNDASAGLTFEGI